MAVHAEGHLDGGPEAILCDFRDVLMTGKTGEVLFQVKLVGEIELGKIIPKVGRRLFLVRVAGGTFVRGGIPIVAFLADFHEG